MTESIILEKIEWDSEERQRAELDALNTTVTQLWRENPRRGLHLAQKAHKLALELPDYHEGAADTHLNLGSIYGRMAVYGKAQNYLLQALKKYQEIQNLTGEAYAWTRLGRIHWRLADYPTASEYHFKSLKIFQTLNDRHGEAEALANLGLVYGLTNDLQAALTTFQQLLSLFRELGDRVNEGFTLNNLAMGHYRAGNLPLARECVLQSLQIAQKNEQYALEIVASDTFGNILLAEGDTEQALFHFQHGARLAQQQGYQHNEVTILLNMGRAMAAQGDIDQALQIWLRVLQQAESLGARYDLRKCHRHMAEFFKQQGDSALALAHFEQYHEIDKVIYNETAVMRLKTLQVIHDVQATKQRNAMLEEEIAERRRIEVALRASQESLHTLIQASPDSIFFKDGQGRWLVANQAALQVFQMEGIAYNSKTDLELAQENPLFREALLHCSRTDAETWAAARTTRAIEPVPQPDGKVLIFDVIKVPLFNDDGSRQGLVIIGRDITAQNRAETALRQAQKTESLGVLAGGVAHDFNNLLVAMLGQMSLAQAKLRPEHQARVHVEKAVKAAERAADLTQKMLAYSGRGHFSIQLLDLNALVAENLHLFQVSIPKNVHLRSDLMPDLPLIEGDAGQMQQVVMNLIINAAEAIGEQPGYVLVKTGDEVIHGDDKDRWPYTGQPVLPGRYAFLEVRDNGEGMDDKTLANIFDPFFTTKDSGHGLGLAAVLGIMRGHQGGIRVTSERGQGTIFRLLFPASQEARALGVTDTAVPQHSPPATHVLIIDDEEPVREAIADILSLINVETLTAPDGPTGLAMYQNQMTDIDLVILDLSMPGMSGAETFEKLRQLNPNVVVLLSSGYTQAEATRGFIGQGLAGFIQKPYNATDLIEKVVHLVPAVQVPADL